VQIVLLTQEARQRNRDKICVNKKKVRWKHFVEQRKRIVKGEDEKWLAIQ